LASTILIKQKFSPHHIPKQIKRLTHERTNKKRRKEEKEISTFPDIDPIHKKDTKPQESRFTHSLRKQEEKEINKPINE